jgi:hypothetical protein
MFATVLFAGAGGVDVVQTNLALFGGGLSFSGRGYVTGLGIALGSILEFFLFDEEEDVAALSFEAAAEVLVVAVPCVAALSLGTFAVGGKILVGCGAYAFLAGPLTGWPYPGFEA